MEGDFARKGSLLPPTPRPAHPTPRNVDAQGSLGVFEVVTVDGFGRSDGGIEAGGLAFQFTSRTSGTLVDTAPFDSVAHLEFVRGDPFGPRGTGYQALLTEENLVRVNWQITGLQGNPFAWPVTFTFTPVPEPSAALLVGLGAAGLAARRHWTRGS